MEETISKMVIRARENLIGAWAFLVGIIISIAVGIFAGLAGSKINPFILGVLAVLGLIVGYFVAEKDVQTFLLASVSLVIVSYAGISGFVLSAALGGIDIGKILSSVLGASLSILQPRQ